MWISWTCFHSSCNLGEVFAPSGRQRHSVDFVWEVWPNLVRDFGTMNSTTLISDIWLFVWFCSSLRLCLCYSLCVCVLVEQCHKCVSRNQDGLKKIFKKRSFVWLWYRLVKNAVIDGIGATCKCTIVYIQQPASKNEMFYSMTLRGIRNDAKLPELERLARFIYKVTACQDCQECFAEDFFSEETGNLA